MPREYITRLTFDRNAQAMAIVQRGYKVVGGIAYRPFPQRQFVEIVFFAISGPYQVNVSVLRRRLSGNAVNGPTILRATVDTS